MGVIGFDFMIQNLITPKKLISKVFKGITIRVMMFK